MATEKWNIKYRVCGGHLGTIAFRCAFVDKYLLNKNTNVKPGPLINNNKSRASNEIKLFLDIQLLRFIRI